MNHDSYINKNEFVALIKVGSMASEYEDMAAHTKDKRMHKMFATMATFNQKILDERLACLDSREAASFARRFHHSKLLVVTNDELRASSLAREDDLVTVSCDDLYELMDKAMLLCLNCEQGEHVKDCPLIDIFIRCGAPKLRTNPAEGECPFRYDDECRRVTPQHTVFRG